MPTRKKPIKFIGSSRFEAWPTAVAAGTDRNARLSFVSFKLTVKLTFYEKRINN